MSSTQFSQNTALPISINTETVRQRRSITLAEKTRRLSTSLLKISSRHFIKLSLSFDKFSTFALIFW
jgi:hypothetical protein